MNKQWFHAGSHAIRDAQMLEHNYSRPRRNPEADRYLQEKKDVQELKRAETDFCEAQRRIARQIVLIGELAERGKAILEPERALVRLQTKCSKIEIGARSCSTNSLSRPERAVKTRLLWTGRPFEKTSILKESRESSLQFDRLQPER